MERTIRGIERAKKQASAGLKGKKIRFEKYCWFSVSVKVRGGGRVV
jgi:hypothetical protein